MSEVVQQLKKKLKEEEKQKKKKKEKRKFKGYKGNIICETGEFSINVPIRHQKVTSNHIDKALNVTTRSKTLKNKDGKPALLKSKYIGDYHKGLWIEEKEVVEERVAHKIEELRDKGEYEGLTEEQFEQMVLELSEVEKDDAGPFQEIDGEFKEVQDYPRTIDFIIEDFIDQDKVWKFLPEKYEEFWSEKNGLWLLAEYLHKNKKLALCRSVVFKTGLKEHYGLFFPVVIDGQYTLVMIATRSNLIYNHLKPATPLAKPEKPKGTPKSVLNISF